MFDHKVIITGPVGAGKTTAIRTYSTNSQLETEARPTDNTMLLKDTTTVAMDYGTIILDAETKVHLYGTPGQQRFEFMWDILSEGSRGIIILLNGESSHPEQDLLVYLEAFVDYVHEVPVVIGVTHAPDDAQVRQQLRLALEQAIAGFSPDLEVDIEFVDVRQSKEVNKLVKRILFSAKLMAH